MTAMRILVIVMVCSAMLASPGCRTPSVGDEYEQWIFSEVSAIAQPHLAALASEAVSSRVPLHRAAAESFQEPKLTSLSPCNAGLGFEYVFEGARRKGRITFVYDDLSQEWLVENTFLLVE